MLIKKAGFGILWAALLAAAVAAPAAAQSSAGASVLAAAYLMPLCYLGWSLFFGRRASENPWQATGLEWETTSPPPTHNFHHIPVVTKDPYAYGEDAEVTVVH